MGVVRAGLPDRCGAELGVGGPRLAGRALGGEGGGAGTGPVTLPLQRA